MASVGKKVGSWVGDKVGGSTGAKYGGAIGGAVTTGGLSLLGGNNGGVGGGNDPFGYGGYGITPGPAQVTPYQVPGLQQGTPLEGDYNLQGPGMGEQYAANNVGRYTDPSQAQQWWQGHQGQFDQPGAAENYFGSTQQAFQTPGQGEQWWQQNQGQFAPPGGSNYAENYFKNWNDQSQGLSANLDPFYGRARERQAADIDKAFGARGMFGSGAALAQQGQSASDLNAQQAKDEAQYGLQRAAEQRAWSGLGGGLANQADYNVRANNAQDLSYLTSGGQFANQAQQQNLARLLGGAGVASQAQNANLARLMGGGNLSLGFDSADLARLNSGANLAFGGQGAREGRIQGMFNNVSMPGMAMFGAQQNMFPQMFQGDQNAMDTSTMFGTGLAQDAVNADRYQNERTRQDFSDLAMLAGRYASGGGLGFG